MTGCLALARMGVLAIAFGAGALWMTTPVLAADAAVKDPLPLPPTGQTPSAINGIVPNPGGKEAATNGPLGPDPMAMRIPRGSLSSSKAGGPLKGLRARRQAPSPP